MLVEKPEEDTDEPVNVEIEDEISEKASEISPEKTIYLSGPIRYKQDNGSQWREKIIEDYPEYNFINPLDHFDPDADGLEKLKPSQEIGDIDTENFDPEKYILDSEIVNSDKLEISRSDAVLVGLYDVIARGTSMEIMYAFMMDIPVYVWTIDYQDASPWVTHHAEIVRPNREILMDAIERNV